MADTPKYTKEEVAAIFGVPVESIPDFSPWTELSRIQAEWLRAMLTDISPPPSDK